MYTKFYTINIQATIRREIKYNMVLLIVTKVTILKTIYNIDTKLRKV